MTTLALPRSLPHMGRIPRWAGAGALAAVLAAGAVVGTVAAERATVGHVVPGLGSYANGGEYCMTQTPPWQTTTMPDVVTLWVDMGNGGPSVQAGPYRLSNADDNAAMKSYLSRAVKIKECWEGK